MTELVNGGFEQGWETLENGNQEPHGWSLFCLPVGSKLWDSDDLVYGIPECVHKKTRQLPDDQQLGGPDALILDGGHVYKVFSRGQSFGVQLSQSVTGLVPDSPITIHVPVRCHKHGSADHWAAEAGVWLNGEGGWHAGLPDEAYYLMSKTGAANANGDLVVVIRAKSKWNAPVDFFLDAIELKVVAEPVEPPEPPERVLVHVIKIFSDGSIEVD